MLYYDTDSVIFVSSPNAIYEPHTGSLLGELTDELEDYGVASFIETFVSGGPKFYAYRVRTPQGTTHDTCKIKGIPINYENSLRINFDSVVSLIQNHNKISEEENIIEVKNRAIKRLM